MQFESFLPEKQMNVKRKNTASTENLSFVESDFDFSRSYPNPFAEKMKDTSVKVNFLSEPDIPDPKKPHRREKA